MQDSSKDRLYKIYEKEITKDMAEIAKEKQKFISEIKGGLGNEIKNINNYIKKEPSWFDRIKIRLSNIFKYL